MSDRGSSSRSAVVSDTGMARTAKLGNSRSRDISAAASSAGPPKAGEVAGLININEDGAKLISEAVNFTGITTQEALQLPVPLVAPLQSAQPSVTRTAPSAGPGIDHQHYDHLFDAFHTSDGRLGDLEDLGDLDFFDPFLGDTFEQFQLPVLQDTVDQFSPLDHMSRSSHPDILDRALDTNLGSTASVESQMDIDDTTTLPQQHSQRKNSDTARSSVQRPQSAGPNLRKHSPILFSDTMRTKLLEDICSRQAKASPSDTFRLPSASALQSCLRTYVDAFHIHLPILHLQSFDFTKVPSPLVLALCAIGALYRLERRVAATLYIKAVEVLQSEDEDSTEYVNVERLMSHWDSPGSSPQTSTNPLWASQARLLLLFFAAFSGEPSMVRRSLEKLGYLSNDNRVRLTRVQGDVSATRLSWHEWIERESIKRLLLGTTFVNNLVTIAYGILPGFSIVHEGSIELPDSDALWNAGDENQWQHCVALVHESRPQNLKDAVAMLINGSKDEELVEVARTWSPFSTAMIMHAVSIQVWHSIDGSGLISSAHDLSAQSDTQLSSAPNKIEAALTRCRSILTQAKPETDGLWTDSDGPLLFNAFAVLRVTYGRAFTGIRLADRMLLLRDNYSDISQAISDYIAMPQERSKLVAQAIARTFEGLVLPFRSGAPLLRKTAALTWSVEHALAGWDSALLVTKWVYAMEVLQAAGSMITADEQQVLSDVHSLLDEVEPFREQGVSAASILSRVWAGFYEDTWVWGVTPRIGRSLRALANAYEVAQQKLPPRS
ncbi:uncharacterized protein AB675_1235 [Cyphellophora attinorum]|uniref:Xylanolytic transcriptional activator regulatory domain-containing protein n=1 Tax=Cyphellophora attinorum TaxID=1664694 RepID=A0A0N1H3X3_9EURO|nr:uncharacterized protein AB675_1235 [Phialophora attinorum]KPI35705.1 hypothetical protein AB675_1235 [Phialophora attinorum]